MAPQLGGAMMGTHVSAPLATRRRATFTAPPFHRTRASGPGIARKNRPELVRKRPPTHRMAMGCRQPWRPDRSNRNVTLAKQARVPGGRLFDVLSVASHDRSSLPREAAREYPVWPETIPDHGVWHVVRFPVSKPTRSCPEFNPFRS